MKNNRQLLDMKVNHINTLLSVVGGQDGFIEINSQLHGKGRGYQLTSHNGSRNLSNLDDLATTSSFADGMIIGISICEQKKETS